MCLLGLSYCLLLPISLVFAPLGAEMAFSSIWLDFTVESTPPGVWKVYNFGVSEYSALHHALVYQTNDGLEVLLKWMGIKIPILLDKVDMGGCIYNKPEWYQVFD